MKGALGAYPVDFVGSWTPPDHWDADGIALEMSDHPCIWADGGREDFSSIGGFEVAGAGVCLPATAIAFDSSILRTAEEHGDAWWYFPGLSPQYDFSCGSLCLLVSSFGCFA